MKKSGGILFLLIIFLGIILLSENVKANEVYCTSAVPGALKPCSPISSIFPTAGNPVNSIFEVPYANGPADPPPPFCTPSQTTSCNATTSCTTNQVEIINNIGGQPISGSDVCRLDKTGVVTAICANVHTPYSPTWIYNWYDVNEFTSLKNTTYAEGAYPDQCTDGIDNDCDGSIDGNESACGGPPETVCNDGKDNDGNGLRDCEEAYCTSDPYCTGCALNQEICYDGTDNNCNNESDWDTQVWDGFYPTGVPKATKGDTACRVDVNKVYAIPVSPLENLNVQVYCNTSVDIGTTSDIGVNSVDVYIGSSLNWIKCTPNTIQWAWGVTTGLFDCPTGSAGNKTIKCEVNTSRSYSDNAVITQPITVQSAPQDVTCAPVSGCGGYTTPASCENDCNNIWTSDQPDNLECGIGMCSSGSTWNSCSCTWNGSACNFGITPKKCCDHDNAIDDGEVCDGTNMNGGLCSAFDSFSGGTLGCDSNCEYNFSQCTGYTCDNDGTAENGEPCDKLDLNGETCSNFDGYSTGVLRCRDDCMFDTSGCYNSTTGGWCSVENQNIVKECDFEPNFGYRNYTWEGTWYGGPGGADETECENDPFSKLVLCPSQFQLPFFNMFSFVLAGIGITIVYYFLIRKKKIVLV